MFVACGLNHITASLNIRETIVVHQQDELVMRFLEHPSINEVVILSTCNRMEIYCDTDDPELILPTFATINNLSLSSLTPYFYQKIDHQAIRHLLRVASGLDSMMLGEPQIFGQMKQAYQQACDLGSVKQHLKQIFQYAFRMSKRIRHESGINNHPISVAFAAVQLIDRLFTKKQSLSVLIIGAGETSSLVGKYLQKQDRHKFMIASRTHESAQELADILSGQALPITELTNYLPKADVVITATSCPIPFITKTLVENAMKSRSQSPMFFLDLAVPRDIEEDVKLLPNIHLYNIDDLQGKIYQGMQERQNAALYAEKLVEQAIEKYESQHRVRKANKIICNYRNHAQAAAQKELQRAVKRLNSGTCQYEVLNEFSTRLIKKLTHMPTIGLKQASLDNRDDLLQLAQYFFTEVS